MVALITNNHNTKLTAAPQPKLSMIWKKESDGGRQRLVARWVAAGEE